MILDCWGWLRKQILLLSMRRPRVAAGLIFLLFLTVSTNVHYVTEAYLLRSSFWQMIVMGALMGLFGSALVYELLRQQRRLAQVELVHNVVTTLHHEISNPLTVIYGSAALLRAAGNYDEPSVDSILQSSGRIREVMARLGEVGERVELRTDCGFECAIDLERSY